MASEVWSGTTTNKGGEEETRLKLPPGFGFYPSDDGKKVEGKVDIDLDKIDPWDLPGKAMMGEQVLVTLYFSIYTGRAPVEHETGVDVSAGDMTTMIAAGLGGGEGKGGRRGSSSVGTGSTLTGGNNHHRNYAADHRWDEQDQYEVDKFKDRLRLLQMNLELLGKEEQLDDFHDHLDRMCKQLLQRLHEQEFLDSLQRKCGTGEVVNRLVMRLLEGFENLPQEEIELDIKDRLEHHMCKRWADYFQQSLGMQIQPLPDDLPEFRRQIECLRRQSLQHWQRELLCIEREVDKFSGGVDTNNVFSSIYVPNSVRVQAQGFHTKMEDKIPTTVGSVGCAKQFLLNNPGGEGGDTLRSNHDPTVTSSTEANGVPLVHQLTEKQSQDKRVGNRGSSSVGTGSTLTGGNKNNHHRETDSASNDMPEVIYDNQSQANCTGNFNVLSNLGIGPENVVLIAANGDEMATFMSGSVRQENFQLTNVHYCPDVGNRVGTGSTLTGGNNHHRVSDSINLPMGKERDCLHSSVGEPKPSQRYSTTDVLYNHRSWATRLNIALEAASALAYMHSSLHPCSVVHADLKPSNIWSTLHSIMEPNISDFGLSRLQHVEPTHNRPLDTKFSEKPSAKRAIEKKIGSYMTHRRTYLSVHHHPLITMLPSARKWSGDIFTSCARLITSNRIFGMGETGWICANPEYDTPNGGPVSEYIIRKLFGIWNGLTVNESQQHSDPDSSRSDHGKMTVNTKTSASWIVATAAPHHATGDLNLLSGFIMEHDDQFVHAVNRVPMKVLARGAVVTDALILPDVWFVPGLTENLVSVSQLAELDHSIGFGRGECCIKSARDAKIVGKGRLQKGGHYVLDYLKVPLAI